MGQEFLNKNMGHFGAQPAWWHCILNFNIKM